MDTTLDTRAEPRATKRTILPLAGVAFVVILLAGVFAAPIPPQPGDSVREIRSYFVEHATGVQVYVYASALSVAFFLLFAVSIQQALLRLGDAYQAAASAVAGAGVVIVVGSLVGIASFGVLSFEASATGDDTVRALFALGNMTYNAGDFILAVMVGIPSLVALRTRLLPKWISWFGVLVAVAWAVAAVAIFAESGPMAGPNGSYGFVVTMAFLVWSAATSISLYRSARTPEALQLGGQR